jgi:hypothetical protein
VADAVDRLVDRCDQLLDQVRPAFARRMARVGADGIDE